MMKLAVLVCLTISTSTFAAESKSQEHGFTKEQHMVAEAACKAINSEMRGKELKECIKEKLDIKSK